MIKRIRIKNYKSLDVDFELDPITVLIGRSGTGKSNFVNAMRFLRGLLKSNSIRDYMHSHSNIIDNILPFNSKEKNCELEFDIEFTIPSTTVKDCKYNLKFEHSSINIYENLTIEDEQKLNYQPSSSWNSTHLHENIRLEKVNYDPDVSRAFLVLTEGVGCYDFPGDVCTDEKDKQESEALDDTAKNYLATFNAIRNNLQRQSDWDDINSSLRTLNSTFKTVNLESREAKRMVVVHDFNGKSKPFSISNESEGFRRFLAHLLALYQTPPKQTLIFEEPERGIHPGALSTLADEFKACAKSGRGQVILTTHSPQLLDQFKPESIRVVEIENGVTKINRIARDQLESIREKLLFPGELLTVEDARADAEKQPSD
ncbi:MAG: AAA family ATPase [Thermoguttaceae bacterium]